MPVSRTRKWVRTREASSGRASWYTLSVRKTEGSGLGMAITKYIVDAMGGTISVHSEQGRGSEFHVVFDLERAAAPAAQAADGGERTGGVDLKRRRSARFPRGSPGGLRGTAGSSPRPGAV